MDGRKQIAGLIGRKVGHSLSGIMQDAAFTAMGIAAHYELWDTEPQDLPLRIASLRLPGILGANVTIPYKTAVLPLLDVATPEALYFTQAANTIVCEATTAGIRLIGHNTDVPGLQRALREEHAWSAGKRVTVLGAGGAARAAIAVAFLEGAEPWVVARRPTAGRELLASFALGDPNYAELDSVARTNWQDHVIDSADTGQIQAVLAETSVLIQATPVGTGDPDSAPLPLTWLQQLPRNAFVFDMVYNPSATALVRAALACGLRASGGMSMLLYQGAAAFSLWTSRPAPLDQMRAALLEHLPRVNRAGCQ
jgi:shikimate dehydrogenase